MAEPDGIVWGATQGNYGQIGLYVTKSSTATATTISVQVWFWSKYSASDMNNTLYLDILSTSGSATTSKGSKSISTTVDSGGGWSTSNQVLLGTYSQSFNHTKTSSTKYIYAKLSGIEVVGSTMYASTTVSVPALTTYTITYNAKGGKNAPQNQTKYYNESIKISTTKPNRDGYSFLGWNTSSSATSANSSYDPGDTYSTNSNLTLYAVWKANTYDVIYDANGGTGAPAKQTKTHGTALTLSNTKPTRKNYTFLGWGVSPSATTVSYAAGAKYESNSAITLYAIWEVAYEKPKISGLKVSRCDSSGSDLNDGTYAKVIFNWSTYYAVTSVKIEWKSNSATTWSSTTVSASGTSDSASKIIGSGALSAELTYQIRITVADSGGNSSVIKTLGSMVFPIDFLAGGKGVAIGKVAELENGFEVGFRSYFKDRAVFDNDMAVYGKTTSDVQKMLLKLSKTNNLVIGYDLYSGKDGGAYIYGNDVNILSRGYINFTGKPIIANRVLWSGAYGMSNTQTVTLSEAVSKQANGIVLVFSGHENGSAKDASWNTFYVSKYEVSAISGGRTFIMGINAGFSKIGAKYLYLADTTITGQESNGSTGTNSGITFNNGYYVLRYVIGV